MNHESTIKKLQKKKRKLIFVTIFKELIIDKKKQ